MREFGIDEFAKFIAGAAMAGAEKKAKRTALEIGARMIRDEAKRALGTYDYGWQQLAQATQDDREKKGYPPNKPGLRTGEMRDSIKYTIISDEEAEIGSDDQNLVYFELGTVKQPPRPVLQGAAVRSGQKIADIAGLLVGSALAGHSELGEILKIAKHALHDLKEPFEILLDAGEKQQ